MIIILKIFGWGMVALGAVLCLLTILGLFVGYSVMDTVEMFGVFFGMGAMLGVFVGLPTMATGAGFVLFARMFEILEVIADASCRSADALETIRESKKD